MTAARWGAIALLIAPALLSAQPQPAAPVFPSNADVVTIDVVVTDEKGEPVPGLTRDDFVVREDGTAQSLALFEAVARPAGTTQLADAPRPAVAANVVPTGDRPLLLVAFDEPHLTPSGVERARRELRKLPDHAQLRGTDVVLVSTVGGGAWLARLPEEGDDFGAALDRFRGLRPLVASGRMKDYEAFLIASQRNEAVATQVYRRYLDLRLMGDASSVANKGMRGAQSDTSAGLPAAGRSYLMTEAEQRWQDIRRRQAATVAGVTRLLRGMEPRGRKAVLLITEGFIQESVLPEYREMSEAARRVHAAVNIVDPRDSGRLFADDADTASSVDSRDHIALMGRELKSGEGADALAAATGGRVQRNLPGLGATLDAIGSELRTYYLLGYEPAVGADGRFHKLDVDVKRPGLRVAARPGYHAVKASAVQDLAAVPLSQLALDTATDAAALPMRLSGYVLAPTAKGMTRVRLVAELEGGPVEGGAPIDLVFQLAARGRPGAQQRATDVKAPGAGESVRVDADFEVEAGVYQARLVARERDGSHRAGSVRHTVEVRPVGEFRTSTPVLTDQANANVPLPRAERRFRRDGKLYCMIEVLGASANASVVAGVDLRQPDGNVRIRIPATPITAVPRSRLWAIPLTDLPPGAYDLMISVQEVGSNRRVAMREGFEVVAQD